MSGTEVEVAVAAGAELAEGPTWDPATGRLIWVDILGCMIHTYDPGTGQDASRGTDQHVGAAKPREEGGLVVNLRDGIGLYEPEGTFRWLAELAREGVRGNDAAIAPDRSLWAGTMRYDQVPGGGALYRVAPGGEVTTILDDVTISNGLGWSPDERLMYYIDTPTGRVDVFDYHGETVTNRRPFTLAGEAAGDGPGLPDGLTVDADGCVWVALYGGGRVHRYTPSGQLDRVIEAPAANTTACAFGGRDLTDLYITSARSDEPLSGSVFVVPDAGQGLPSPAYAG
ncbi:SMP-30/gluconolactonase/LRE family protein [Actinomadura alba]|uniref:SMP-30/gluconolactonase/LRE family protein n=1 Tax=Actinomadura alba TaxID=406431 RepID=A0ABR7LTN9_9ACTN|nr:SMP-30/gluconolactonase/LRE family protein [Actinomadura alba]MBC6468135.1 SMP-30/gluconolactonase/LRE family protein [Actinomadura alba]